MAKMTTKQSRRNKAKGRDAENNVVQWLKDNGFMDAERIRTRGIKDIGDIGGVPSWMIEVKNHAKTTLAQFIAEMEAQLENIDKEKPHKAPHYGVVVMKKKGTLDVDKWYVLTTGEMLMRIIKESTHA